MVNEGSRISRTFSPIYGFAPGFNVAFTTEIVRHRLERRVRAHVFLCILALLLKRILEIDCLGNTCVTEPLETVAKSKLVTYQVKMSERSSITKKFRKVTNVSPQQQHYFNLVGVKNPATEANYSWWETWIHHLFALQRVTNPNCLIWVVSGNFLRPVLGEIWLC